MKTEKFTTTILVAAEGMFLTQAGETAPADRAVAGRVYLGKGDSPENWTEIDAETAERYKKEKEEAAEALMEHARGQS